MMNNDTSPIRLGLMAPLSGLVQLYGVEISRAARAACAEINASGGLLGRELELVIVDDGSVPETALPAAQRLIDEFNCTAIIGNLLSNSRIAVAEQVAEPYRVPYLNFSFYEGSISGRYFFHFAALPNQQIDCMIPYMAKHFGFKMFFAGNNYEWPRGSIDAGKRILERIGGEVMGEVYLPTGNPDFGELLERLARSGADVFVPYFAGSDQVELLTRFHASGLKSRMAVVMGHYDEAMVRHLSADVRAGLYSCNTYFMSVDTPENHAVLQRIAEQTGVAAVLTNFSEGTYVCVEAFAEAVRAAESTHREALVEALEQIQVRAPQGLVVMDPATHHAHVNTYLARCEADGKFTLIERFGRIAPQIPARYRAQPTAVGQQEDAKWLPEQDMAHGDGLAVFDREQNILHVNEAFRNMWGARSSAELLKRPVAGLWQDQDAWRAAVTAAHNEDKRRFFLRGRLTDGSARRFEVVLEEDHAGLSTFLCRPAAAAEHDSLSATVARILQVADIAVLACDEAGSIIQANVHARELFGYPGDELFGLSVHLLVPPAMRGRHAEHYSIFWRVTKTPSPWAHAAKWRGIAKTARSFPRKPPFPSFATANVGSWWLLCATSANASGTKRNWSGAPPTTPSPDCRTAP